jgi:hypothetical protein
VEVVKEMIHDQNIPMFLWIKASNTIVYIHNISPHQILEDKTLEEAFIEVKLEVNHLRIFGCIVYIHVPKEKRTELEPSRKEGTFVGYRETSKYYRIYILGQRHIKVIHDVTFNEEINFKTSKNYHLEIVSE